MQNGRKQKKKEDYAISSVIKLRQDTLHNFKLLIWNHLICLLQKQYFVMGELSNDQLGITVYWFFCFIQE